MAFFFEVIGAVLIFGLIGVFFPTTAYIVSLVVALHYGAGFEIIVTDPTQQTLWQLIVLIVVIAGLVVAFLLDIIKLKALENL